MTLIPDTVQETIATREETELRGAWRAGHDRVDVYNQATPLGRNPGQFALGRAYVPRDDGDPRLDLPGYRYAYSYDLTSVPDDVILDAIRDAT